MKLEKEILIENKNKIHTTPLGVKRIQKNLKIDVDDVVSYCKNKILKPECKVYKKGKNWYCEINQLRITIHMKSYTIITAHLLKI